MYFKAAVFSCLLASSTIFQVSDAFTTNTVPTTKTALFVASIDKEEAATVPSSTAATANNKFETALAPENYDFEENWLEGKFGQVSPSGLLEKIFLPRVHLEPSLPAVGSAAVAVLLTTQLDLGITSVIIAAFLVAAAVGTAIVGQTTSDSKQVCLPLWVYEWANWFLRPVIFWYCTMAPYTLAKRLDFASADTKTMISVEELANHADALDAEGLAALKERVMTAVEVDILENELHVAQLFDTLEPAVTSTMVGHTFKGNVVRTKSTLDVLRPLVNKLAEYDIGLGKRFFSPYYGDPLVIRLPPNNSLVIPFPFGGNVGIHEIEYRGKKQATMVYDNQPWQDYFRILDMNKETGEVTVLGIWNVRDVAGGWFILTQIKDLQTSELMQK